MELSVWIYYTFAVLVLTASPGPMVLLCITTSVKKDLKSALFVAFGGLISINAIIAISFTSLGAIIASSEMVFTVVKYAGAFYLVYLGYKAITSKQEDYDFKNENKNDVQKEYKALFVKGLLVGISNPKAIVFFMALLPQFINQENPLLIQYLVFAGTFSFFELVWLIFYSYLGAKSSSWFMQKGRAKFFNRITGGVFVGAGVVLSTVSK